MILVAGGTGRLGTQVVSTLAARGLDVRVLTRNANRARHLADLTIEIVIGDVRDPVSLGAAMWIVGGVFALTRLARDVGDVGTRSLV